MATEKELKYKNYDEKVLNYGSFNEPTYTSDDKSLLEKMENDELSDIELEEKLESGVINKINTDEEFMSLDCYYMYNINYNQTDLMKYVKTPDGVYDFKEYAENLAVVYIEDTQEHRLNIIYADEFHRDTIEIIEIYKEDIKNEVEFDPSPYNYESLIKTNDNQFYKIDESKYEGAHVTIDKLTLSQVIEIKDDMYYEDDIERNQLISEFIDESMIKDSIRTMRTYDANKEFTGDYVQDEDGDEHQISSKNDTENIITLTKGTITDAENNKTDLYKVENAKGDDKTSTYFLDKDEAIEDYTKTVDSVKEYYKENIVEQEQSQSR